VVPLLQVLPEVMVLAELPEVVVLPEVVELWDDPLVQLSLDCSGRPGCEMGCCR
jgi:hypothetical protein